MPDEPSDRPIRWSWTIWGCFAIGLGTVAWMQIRVNAALLAERVAWATAANHQLALNEATGAAVLHYRESHSFGNPRKPMLEQFCKDMNGGRPIDEDGIYRDPVTGGEVRIFSFQDGQLGEMVESDGLPSHAAVRFAVGIYYLRVSLEISFFLAWVAVCVIGLVLCMDGSRRNRIVLGQWLVFLSFSLTFVGFMERPADKTKWWGLAFLAFSGLYLVWAIISGREKDPTSRCAKCQYHLTGNQSRICPECGTPVETEVVG